jgi:hypothetical protein
MFKIDEKLQVEIKDFIVYEYEWHYLWEPGFKDMFYYSLIEKGGKKVEYRFSEMSGKIRMEPKF